ncbi:TonB family protein [Teredinibacter waterburyi]|jgi:TonB family C-terminal domain|uniref:TonB family protein n=1 Tax=Teredinibacter waterburyi TaxID=1500538 RepID=UPI00165F3922|nr:TonB family protein [Teredinibacter waterburyi]
MTAQTYQTIALDWLPDSREERSFILITVSVFIVMFALALVLDSITVPEVDRFKSVVPDRVAEFIEDNEVEVVPTPEPTPIPTPVPIPTPKPKVARDIAPEIEAAPLTEVEQEAREKASQSGLLALASEMADLIDSSDVDDLVATQASSSDAAKQAAVHSTDVLTAGVSEGSGGVDAAAYTGGGIGSTSLSKRDVALVKQSLFKDGTPIKGDGVTSKSSGERTGKVRSEEEVTIVFDQNKGSLYSIYNRERRKNPSLKGKVVLEITIAPNGSVTNIRIVSSQLNDPALERRLLARIKTFKFGEKDVEAVTVTFPIEFLPS